MQISDSDRVRPGNSTRFYFYGWNQWFQCQQTWLVGLLGLVYCGKSYKPLRRYYHSVRLLSGGPHNGDLVVLSTKCKVLYRSVTFLCTQQWRANGNHWHHTSFPWKTFTKILFRFKIQKITSSGPGYSFSTNSDTNAPKWNRAECTRLSSTWTPHLALKIDVHMCARFGPEYPVSNCIFQGDPKENASCITIRWYVSCDLPSSSLCRSRRRQLPRRPIKRPRQGKVTNLLIKNPTSQSFGLIQVRELWLLRVRTCTRLTRIIPYRPTMAFFLQVTAPTLGWLGIGFSTRVSMVDSDLIMMGVTSDGIYAIVREHHKFLYSQYAFMTGLIIVDKPVNSAEQRSFSKLIWQLIKPFKVTLNIHPLKNYVNEVDNFRPIYCHLAFRATQNFGLTPFAWPLTQGDQMSKSPVLQSNPTNHVWHD